MNALFLVASVVLEFSCPSPPTADVDYLVEVHKTSEESAVITRIHGDGHVDVFNARRRAVPPGADERITYTYTAPNLRLQVLIEPDFQPVAGHAYDASWNGAATTCKY